MKNNQNIEDVFRQGMDDYKVTPSDKVWSGINKKLVGPRFDASFKNAFNGFKVSPSEQIWRRVAAAVWFNKFIHFTPFSFNIYYLGFIMTAVVGTVITVNNNPNLEFFHYNQPKTEQTAPVETIENVTIENEVDLNSTGSNTADLIPQEPINKDEIKTNVAENSNNSNTIDYNLIVENNNQNKESNNEKDISLTDKTVEILNPSVITTDPDEQITTNTQAQLTDNNNSQRIEILPAKLQQLKKFKLSYKPIWSDYADNAFQSAPERDEIVYDTIGYNYLGEPVVVEKSWFALELSFSPHLFNCSSELLNQELLSNYNFYKANNKPGFSFCAGLGLSYNYNRLNIETGVYYHKFNQSISQTVKVYDPFTSSYFDYFENEEWEYDTTMILDLDEYLNGNIVYIPYVDSSLVYFTDSTEIFYADSVLIDKLLSAANSYRIIDVPIIAGYEMRFNRFTATPKAGIITGFLTKRTGTAYNLSDGTIFNAELLPTNNIVFDYYAAVNLKFDITKHLSLFAEPHIRGDLNSLYPTSYFISEKSRKFGIKTGISYKF